MNIELLFSRVDVDPGGCWLWLGPTTRDGYGRFGKAGLVHRTVYEELTRTTIGALTIDHLCRVHNCVNPDHLEPVTRGVNTLRGYGPTAANARKTECPAGHPLDAANTYIYPNGGRKCRKCTNAQVRAYKLRRAAVLRDAS